MKKKPEEGEGDIKYIFKSPHQGDSGSVWTVETDSLEKAIRRFRIGCLYPHDPQGVQGGEGLRERPRTAHGEGKGARPPVTLRPL